MQALAVHHDGDGCTLQCRMLEIDIWSVWHLYMPSAYMTRAVRANTRPRLESRGTTRGCPALLTWSAAVTACSQHPPPHIHSLDLASAEKPGTLVTSPHSEGICKVVIKRVVALQELGAFKGAVALQEPEPRTGFSKPPLR